jgi:3-phenylpropionate/trans-cinnamate dioxygenase ferredoxin subunit
MSFQPAIRLDDLPDVGAVLVSIDNQRLAIVRDEDGGLHAVDDTCSHANVSLSEGEVDGCTIECWLHGSRFDLRTGKPTSLPAIRPIAVFPIQIEDGTVLVDVEAPLSPDQIAALTLESTAVKEH